MLESRAGTTSGECHGDYCRPAARHEFVFCHNLVPLGTMPRPQLVAEVFQRRTSVESQTPSWRETTIQFRPYGLSLKCSRRISVIQVG